MSATTAPAALTAEAVGATESYMLAWRGIGVVVTFPPACTGCADCRYDHLEVLSAFPRRPLPMTETGYQSLFLPAGEIESLGEPIAYVMRWLDQAARTPQRKAAEGDKRQGRLFLN